MDIQRNGSIPSAGGSRRTFTGTVRIDSPFQAPDPARVGGAIVTFEQGARTAWHTHPLGQTLIVTSGLGWVQREGEPSGQLNCLTVLEVKRTWFSGWSMSGFDRYC